MKKVKYILLFSVFILLYVGCSKQNPITGPAGAQGATGGEGGNLIPIELGPTVLTPSQISKNPKPGYYYYAQRLYGYNKNLSYMMTTYVTKQDTGHFPAWYKLPYVELFGADEMYCSIGNDSLYLWYYNPVSDPITAFADTNITYKIVIIPQQ
ncbi:MAG TPA: hypothetical protein VK809_13410 [Bacteroidia bacterium]|jgi:hypothetical protein|nr:hypothetical protein [Bacteroidia bacterium]